MSDQSNNKGLLPQDVFKLILKREWHNLSNLKARLIGHKPFPIKIGLKPYTGHQAVKNLSEFQQFVASWKDYPKQQFIKWETRSFRQLSTQQIPCFIELTSISDLIEYLGDDAKKRSELWQCNMVPLLPLSSNIYPVLIKHLNTIENFCDGEAELLKNLIQQLSPNMGEGLYLRAIPLVGIDTKFLEQHKTIVSDLLDVIHQNGVTQIGGLHQWLGCLKNPKGWLTVRPLCDEAKQKMGGFDLLQLSTNELMHYELPANNILVVENLQSGLALPALKDTIAVFGGGKNVQWLEATWLNNKNLAYWGDIDTWGLAILSDVRSKQAHVKALMMTVEILNQFKQRSVEERQSVNKLPSALTKLEEQLFLTLKSKESSVSRLEQERLSMDCIIEQLNNWLKN